MLEENVNELIYLYHMKDEEALPRLIAHFRPMVSRIVVHHSLNQRSSDREDYFLQADLDLVECLERFRPDSGHSFSTYYYRVVSNGAKQMLREISRKSTLHREDTVSLQRLLADGTHHELLPPHPENLHNRVMARFQLEEIARKADPEMHKILECKYRGMTLSQTASTLGLSHRHVRYRLDKLHAKIDGSKHRC